MPVITIELTEAQIKALDTVAVDRVEWVDNLVTSRAFQAREALKTRPAWGIAAAQVADPSDEDAVLLKAVELGLVKTAQQEQEEAAARRKAEMEEMAQQRQAVPVPPAPLVPHLSPRQLRLALAQTGTTEAAVDAIISAIPDATEASLAMIEWKHATHFRRADPLVASLGAALGYSETEIDTLWTWAQTL